VNIKFVTALAGAMAAAAPAIGADLGGPGDQFWPLAAYDWNGFHIGWYGGVSSGTMRSSLAILGEPVAFSPQQLRGLVSGPTIGIDWQMGNLLIGAEMDGQLTNQLTNVQLCPGSQCSAALFSFQEKLPWIATTRARVGLAAARFLVYGTGGLAVQQIKSEARLALSGPGAAQNFTDTELGWVAGGGIEFAFLDHWTAKLEYLHVQTGSATDLLPAAGLPHPLVGISTRISEDIVRTGVAFRFGGGPIMR
jgi:opacity protein-like surface antigen